VHRPDSRAHSVSPDSGRGPDVDKEEAQGHEHGDEEEPRLACDQGPSGEEHLITEVIDVPCVGKQPAGVETPGTFSGCRFQQYRCSSLSPLNATTSRSAA
jgi:hypothetical protein